MNHLFHKLANDAWIDVPEGQGYGGKIFSKEKFAELLIRECADCSYHMDRDSGPITAALIKIRIMSLME